MTPPYFPIGPTDLEGDWTFAALSPGERQIEGFDVLVREIPHKGGRTFGYRVSDGHATLAYMPDHCPTALGPGPGWFGEYHAAALELAGNVDMLVHDSQLSTAGAGNRRALWPPIADYAVELGGALVRAAWCFSTIVPTAPTSAR